MIEELCNYPQLVLVSSALIGALINAGVSVYKKKKKDKKFKFEKSKLVDTIWQSTAAGFVATTTMSCGYMAIATAIVTGVGADKVTNQLNKLGIKVNVVELLAKLLAKADKKK